MARVRCRTPGELPFYRLPYPVLLPLGPRHREQGKILHLVHADMRLDFWKAKVNFRLLVQILTERL